MTADRQSRPVAVNRMTPVYPAHDRAQIHHRRVAERAKVLAIGLASYLTPGSIPPDLQEPSYLCEESHNRARPLLERLRILGLMAVSLDQFYVDRAPGTDGRNETPESPALDSAACSRAVSRLLQRVSRLLRTELLSGLAQERGILLRQPATLAREQRTWLRSFFQAQVFPLLTPLAIDPGHPFPFISSYSLNFLVQLRGAKAGSAASENYARIKVPRMLSRFVEVPQPDITDESNERSFVWSEEIVRFFLPELFPGLSVENTYLFRVLRPLPAFAGQADAPDFLPVYHHRGLVSAVARLDVEADMPESMLAWLANHLGAPADGIFRIDGYMALFQLTDLINLVEGSAAGPALI